MQALYLKLVSLLQHKHQVLIELIEKQRDLRAFLVKPDWSRYFEMTRPQEALLTNLQQVMAAQDALLSEMAKRRGVPRFKTLGALAESLGGDWRATLLEHRNKIQAATQELRKYSRQSQMMQQAQWQFIQKWLNAGQPGRLQAPNAYNARGFAHQSIDMGNSLVQEV
ncbi:Flagellar export chaperone FlgN [Sulfidibacter corallicola]|uniref:Flagellar export chaperone FlgN n=1 Tax=Sulfidibacter corallicola TaxID=2818388 RepID=A0A8A4TVI4_SULCO|nr:flagellar export chaperone FlgN [Sulfidibacter corallicola]QTD53949.1 flagellar export chaperone FlgN [Sulfidibacter corallicola]